MAAINMILQGKGGVGKSFTASLLSQYLLDRDQLVGCFDADPVNATLTAYASLKATKIEIMEGDSINSRLFDTMIEKLLQLPDKAFAVIDSGGSEYSSSTVDRLGESIRHCKISPNLEWKS